MIKLPKNSYCMNLKKTFHCILVGLVFSFSSNAQQYTSFVDPYIGSGGHGHVFVGASVPFSAVQVGPDNFYQGWDWCSGYHYSDSLITNAFEWHRHRRPG